MEEHKKCQLCGKTTKLIKAHIIPRYFDKPLRDNNGAIMLAHFDNDEQSRLTPSPFDKNILCEKCDNDRLGKLDKYAAEFLVQNLHPRIRRPKQIFGRDEIIEHKIADVDYKMLKLFLLSVLWRSHVTSLPFFDKVDIGEHAESIKKMILENDPGNEDTFPIYIISIINITGEPLNGIVIPEAAKSNDLHICRLMFGGVIFFIQLGTEKFLKYPKYQLQENNKILLPTFSGLSANIELREWNYPKQYVDHHTLRVFSREGNIIEMAQKGHFDILVILCNCEGKQSDIYQKAIDNFEPFSNYVNSLSTRVSKRQLGTFDATEVPLNLK
ncbi:hypothetical protein [Chitinophaga arvensicola]|uniref:HNH endonuclease n=1 Tax=Chitinophaga arvensicola TaxID=29529 RepID=A0A1I0SED6_9BACT|nr:hypothetical protein [Chitinophaga arvensicola]SEW57448.1 hypothetical protein SAMN04488122_6789 [Chitinophaga arvensicola]